jgi:hypothetical protein
MPVHLVDPVGGGSGQSIQECCDRGHVLAHPSKGWRWCIFMVDGGGDDSGSSSGFGEVNGGGSLHSQCGLVSVHLGHLTVEGRLLAGKLIVALSYPPARSASLCWEEAHASFSSW